jgi:cell division GTPase FtsZ
LIAIVGLGGAGGNIADEAAKLGIYSGAINFSQKDLDSLENVKLKLRILGSEGVGHDRDEAIRLVQDHYEMVIKFIGDNFSHVDVIFLATSASGGSGAGSVGILTEILKAEFPDKIFSVIAVMPDYLEVPASQANCSATYDELSRMDVSIFPVDNQKARSIHNVNGKNRIFEITNKSIVSIIHKIWSYTEKNSKNGNFDKKDFMTIISQKGIAVAVESEIACLNMGLNTQVSTEGIARMVHESWEKSIFAPIEYEYVNKAAIILDAQEMFMEHINHEMIFSKFKNGMPIDMFEGNYHEQNGKIITILSGLPWCKSRLHTVEELIEKNKEKIEQMTTASMEYESKSTEVLSTIRKPVQQESRSVNEILNKWKKNR